MTGPNLLSGPDVHRGAENVADHLERLGPMPAGGM